MGVVDEGATGSVFFFFWPIPAGSAASLAANGRSRDPAVASGAAVATGGSVGPVGPAGRSALDEPGGDRPCPCRQAGLDRDAAAPPGASPRPRWARSERVGGAHPSAAARLGAGGGGGRADRRLVPADPDRSPTDPVGLVLRKRHALLQLAAGAGAARRCRLRDRPRALPPAGPKSLRRRSGHCSSGTARIGADNAPGCASTGPSSSRSNRRTEAPYDLRRFAGVQCVECAGGTFESYESRTAAAGGARGSQADFVGFPPLSSVVGRP